MSIWETVTSDLKMDANYGDIEISGGDIMMSRRTKDILKNVVIERYKTGFNDFLLNKDYGANLDRFFGKGLDVKLAEDLRVALRYSLTYDDYLNSGEVDIVVIILENSAQIYTYITTGEDNTLAITAEYSKEGLNFD